MAGNMVVEGLTTEYGKAYVIGTYAVVDTGEDAATSSRLHPSVVRRLRKNLNLNVVAAYQADLSQGRPPPKGTENALVVPHYGDNLSDIRNKYAWMGAFGHLSPKCCGGSLDTTLKKRKNGNGSGSCSTVATRLSGKTRFSFSVLPPYFSGSKLYIQCAVQTTRDKIRCCGRNKSTGDEQLYRVDGGRLPAGKTYTHRLQ